MTRDELETFNAIQARKIELEKENAELREHAGSIQHKLERLEEQVNYLLKKLYAPRGERFENPAQQDIFSNNYLTLPECEKKSEAEAPRELERIEYTRAKQAQRGPKPLPDHLPRRVVHIDPEPEARQCACCSQEMQRRGEVVTEELEVVPPKFQVVRYVQGEWRCATCMNRDLVAPLPPRPIPKGRPSPSLLAFIIVSKYCDHLPLYRIERIFKRYGIDISRSTMDSWLGPTSVLLRAIVEALKRELLSDKLLQVDETTIRALDPSLKGRSRRCYMWAYCRPYGEVVYDFTLTRSGRWPKEFLGDFSGHLQCDGYVGYNCLWSSRIIHIACMSHIRRKFFEAKDSAPKEVTEILDLFAELWRIEREAKDNGVSGADLVAVRDRDSRPLLARVKERIEALGPRALPKSKLGKAVEYARNQWDALLRYLDVPEAFADNNSCEQVIKSLVIGRKNFLFLGSTQGGGERAEVFFSLVQSCNRLGIDPYRYLVDVLTRLPRGDFESHLALTPRHWQAAVGASENLPARPSL